MPDPWYPRLIHRPRLRVETVPGERLSLQGDRILFWSRSDKGEYPLWSISLDGSDPRLVVAGT